MNIFISTSNLLFKPHAPFFPLTPQISCLLQLMSLSQEVSISSNSTSHRCTSFSSNLGLQSFYQILKLILDLQVLSSSMSCSCERSKIRKDTKGDSKITKVFHHILEEDQKTHGKNDVVIDAKAVNGFQQQVNDLIDIGTLDAAIAIEADDEA
ncbi:hypothetical protein MSAN_01830700 [Mycena sanguinolenta]|uniref:Uncharacterized protein n=1 Tax=Mycena sanguinolenta TaxID=230812 RepID=A0A8H7CRY1_9AGAR|nr:hypothetical protein MSAN_01830700 [Mycena sanguinolenta]